MVNLTFGEQVKLILSRRGMTIKRLAEMVEEHTGKPMSRQNMTQRLNRDNFQEQDMRMIAEILGCKFELNILDVEEPVEHDITIGELAEMLGETMQTAEKSEDDVTSNENIGSDGNSGLADSAQDSVRTKEEKEVLRKGIGGYFRRSIPKSYEKQTEEGGDINPYTGKEYQSNSVRMHPKRIGYVQVYDQEKHQWTDMTEWAFLGYQERKKALLGKDYVPPIFLD